MKVDGQKVVRVEKEVDLGAGTVAKKQAERPANAPTLRRPGEEMPESNPANPSTTRPIAPPQVPGPVNDPGPNWSSPPAPVATSSLFYVVRPGHGSGRQSGQRSCT